MPEKTACYILQRDPPLRETTRAWLVARPFAVVMPIHRAPTWPAAMNIAADLFLRETDLPRMLILHGNADPNAACDDLFTIDAPVLHARHADHHPPTCRGQLQCGFLLIRRDVLQTMTPPRFAQDFDWPSQTLTGCPLRQLRRIATSHEPSVAEERGCSREAHVKRVLKPKDDPLAGWCPDI